MVDSALAFAREHRQSFLRSLMDLLRIPSVSMESEHAVDMQEAADWLAKKLQSIGLSRIEMPATDPRHVGLIATYMMKWLFLRRVYD